MSLFLKKNVLRSMQDFFCINRRATNLAVVGETGRYPFMFDIVVNMLKYYKRLCTSDDVLLKMLIKNPLPLMTRTSCVKTILEFFRFRYFCIMVTDL